MSVMLSTDLLGPATIRAFLWGEPMAAAVLRERFRAACDSDAWLFTTPAQIAARWDELGPHLGRRRPFWEFLLGRWRQDGLLGG